MSSCSERCAPVPSSPSESQADFASLQAKSALTGMIIVNDGRDGAQKQQMDLVMARAEAAKYVLTFATFGLSRHGTDLSNPSSAASRYTRSATARRTTRRAFGFSRTTRTVATPS